MTKMIPENAPILKWLRSKIQSNPKHLFPAFVSLVFFVMVLMGLHGSSIGLIYEYFSPPGSPKDPALVKWSPQPIRSDEWLILTPKTISQSDNNFNVINRDIGFGEDTAILIDAPVWDWSVIFSPQNLGFFILPLNNALAFKWWFMFAALLISVYYFVLRFFTKNIIAAIALSVFLAYAPLLQWTFRNFLLVPIVAGLVSIMLIDEMRKKNIRKSILLIFSLAYVFVAYTLVLYPPFQIGTAIVLGVFYLFYVLNERRETKSLIRSHKGVVISVLLASMAVLAFYMQHKPALNAVSSSVHPGVRHFVTGDINSLPEVADLWTTGTTRLLNNHEASQQQRYLQVTKNGNQSEAASTIWLLPPLLVMTILLLLERRRVRRSIHLVIGVLSLQIFNLVYLFLPGLKLPVIDQIQPNRANLIILLVNFLSVGLLLKYAPHNSSYYYKNKLFNYIAVAGWIVHVVVMAVAFRNISVNFHSLISAQAIALALLAVLVIGIAFLKNKLVFAVSILAFITVVVSYDVNPLYRGLNSIKNVPIISSIRAHDAKDSGGWFFDGPIHFIGLPLLAGVQTITTNQSYEQDYWKILDPTGKDDFKYSRSAHITGDIREKTTIELPFVNRLKVNLNPCDTEITKKLNIKYVVSSQSEDFSDFVSSCMHEIESMDTSSFGKVRIYKISPSQ